MDTHTRQDTGASFVMDGRGPVSFARVAEEYNRALGQELADVEDWAHADLVREAKQGELEARAQFKVFSLVEMGPQPKEMVGARWASTREEADGAKTVEARFPKSATWKLRVAWVADRLISS